MPNLFVIAGPNGAGKSTSAPELLTGARRVDEFVNAECNCFRALRVGYRGRAHHAAPPHGTGQGASRHGVRNDAFQPLAAASNSSHAAGRLFVSPSVLLDSGCGPGGAA